MVLVTGDGAEHLAGILARLRRQTIAPRLEVILVTRARHVDGVAALRPNEFGAFRVIAGDLSTSARGRAMGVKAASADITIFAEDHCFPVDDRWAERIVDRFAGDWDGVGPVVDNANPATGASCATHLLEYGLYARPDGPAEVRLMPGHNSGYRTARLTAYGEGLADMLETEWRLQNDMRARGSRFVIDPEIRVAHLNYARFGSSLSLHHLAGRMFAAHRRIGRGPVWRLGFAAAAPLIFAKRLGQAVMDALASDIRPDLPRALPATIAFLAVSAAGEAMGYLFGTGGREGELAKLEYSRWRHVMPDEADLQLNPAE